MQEITNTSAKAKNDPMMQGWVMGGDPGAIERQEAQGQKELVNSAQLPVDGTKGKEDLFAEIGIVLGEPTKGDDIFRAATLPQGWEKRPAPDHSMWSYLYDAKGRKRAGIFYKAAFYDRSAYITLERRFSARKDYDHSRKDGVTTVRAHVLDGATEIHVVELDIAQTVADNVDDFNAKWGRHPRPDTVQGYYVEELAEKQARDWLTTNYPNWEDPTAYWE